MSIKRDFSLTPRKEGLRAANPITIPVKFTLLEIKHHFDESMSSVKNQYSVADYLLNNGDSDGCKTIWRSQVVLAEGLLDYFIHEMSKYCLFRMFTGEWEASKKYAFLLVPMKNVEEAISAVESKDWFFSYLNERFSRDVFLSLDSMRDQLNLMGIGFVPVMKRAFPRSTETESKKDGSVAIQELFLRRNAIAHQNDRSHASAKQSDITKAFVEDYISKIEAIVSAIHDIAEEKANQQII